MTEYTVNRLKIAFYEPALNGLTIVGMERVIVKGKENPVGIYSVSKVDNDSPPTIIDFDPYKVVKLTEK